jgi:hypothetical protein
VELNLALPFIVIVRVQFTLPKMQEQIILMSDITLLMMLLSKVWSRYVRLIMMIILLIPLEENMVFFSILLYSFETEEDIWHRGI